MDLYRFWNKWPWRRWRRLKPTAYPVKSLRITVAIGAVPVLN